MKKVVLALGSNLGDRRANLEGALQLIAAFFEVAEKSRIYETSPVGFDDQRYFLNAAVFGHTDLDAEDFLRRCKAAEEKLGRTPKPFPNAPREIDLDIIFFDSVEMQSEELVLPHPRWTQRDFVISPLLDLMDRGVFEFESLSVHKVFLSSKIRKERVFCAFK